MSNGPRFESQLCFCSVVKLTHFILALWGPISKYAGLCALGIPKCTFLEGAGDGIQRTVYHVSARSKRYLLGHSFSPLCVLKWNGLRAHSKKQD